jgi:hypothetical protein
MDTRARTVILVLGVALVGIGVAARAEPTLRYDYHYACNQEHIVVARCRKDSDTPDMPPTTPEDDYCQLYYPDRPKTGGFTAMGTMLRADVIKTLQACGAFGATDATPGGSAKAGATSAPAGPARPRAADTQAGSTAQTQKRFCDQILQLRSHASQGFRSIDLGPKKGEPPYIHATSLSLITSDGNCFIGRKRGERPYYLCSWLVYDDSSNTYDEARIQAVSNMLASCLNVRPDWSEKNGVDSLDISSLGADYDLAVLAGELMLTVEPAQPGRPSAPTNSPAAATAPARAGGTAPATRGRPEFWMVGMTEDRHTMFFVDKASILRKPGGTVEFRRERIEKSSGKVAWLKKRSEIDCNRRTSRDLEVFAYRDDETLIGAVQPAPEAAITESTVGARILAFVCQGKEDTAVKLATGESTIMFFAIEQDDQGLDRSPAEAPSKSAIPANPRPATLSEPAPARPENGATQGDSKAAMRQQLCRDIVQLRSIAPQGFKSIVRGPMKGVPGSSAVSVILPGADPCYVTPNSGKPPDYTCSWTLGAETAERQFRGLGNLLAHCLEVRPDWSLMEVGEWQLDLESAGTRFFFVGDKERGSMALMIQVAEH